MIKLPMSDFMQNYYQEKGITFTDSEKATILWNSALPLPKAEILNALKEISDTTEDKTLKTQINERLDAEWSAIRRFRDNDGRYFFICTPTDEDSEKRADHYFAALEAAIAYGKGESCGIFCIEKKIFEDCCTDDDSDEAYAVYDCAWYTKDGEMIHCARFPYMFGISRDIETGGASSFEDAYIPLQNPFEAGDIVRIAGDSRPAIVQESREQWYSLLERNTKEPHTFHSTYDDNCLRVEFLGEDGEMFHAHPYLLSLEKVNQWEDKFEWDLLQAMSWLMKGVGEIDYLFCCYEKNLAHKRKG